MSDRQISSLNSRSESTTSSKTISNNQYIYRLATDRSAVLGSFYDARTECIVGKLPLEHTLRTKTSRNNTVNCVIMKSETFDKENLFRMNRIDDQSWLNSILNIVPSEGISSLVNYSFPKTPNTRFLANYYSSKEQSFTFDLDKAKTDIPDTIATHVISTIKFGIQAFIVLQLSPINQTNLHCLLENIAQQLIINKFELTSEEKLSLDGITITKIFSNIPDLYKMSTLADVCQQITAIKPDSRYHFPLEYSLRTIFCFYPSYPMEKAKYIPLEGESIKTIKQYLLSLSSKMEELNISLCSKDEHKIQEERLIAQYDALRQQFAAITDIYSTEITRVSHLVFQIRSGIIEQELITGILFNTTERSLEKSINSIIECLWSLKKKEQLINSFNQKNIEYLNMQQYSIEQTDDLTTIFEKLRRTNKPELIFCSADHFKNPNSSVWNDHYRRWMKKRETNSLLTLVYADFTYTSYQLSAVAILSNKSTDNIEKPSTSLTSPNPSHQEQRVSPEKQLIDVPKPVKSPKSSVFSVLEQSPVEQTSTLSTTLAPQPPPRKNKQSSVAKNLCDSPESAKISTTEDIVSSNEQLKSLKASTRSTSDIHLALDKENEDNNKSLEVSTCLEQSNIGNTSAQPAPSIRVKDLPSSPRLPTPLTAHPPLPLPRRRSTKPENPLNTTESSNASAAESTSLSNGEMNDGKELSHTSYSPITLTPRAAPRTKKDPSNTEEFLNQQTASEGPSDFAGEQVFPSNPPTILPSKTIQQTEKQSQSVAEQFTEIKYEQPLATNDTELSKQQANDVKKQSDIQRSQILTSVEITPRQKRRKNLSHSSTVNYINMLLLGESGVGKSTFINALLNYHAFENLEQARSNQPLVAMPVSFLMTDGDNFEEKIIKFGDVDPNEDHNHPGQSVTQHCRSYVFSIDTHTKLRIIDTPGMGDTRGLEQDDLNMQHILSFISNLSELNAICILIKPNESRLTIAFRTYFTRLLNFLGENARHNIVFCFTNTRATFFAPGNTAPLLKKMINELSNEGIPFEKRNTFCFDSEAFRYLMALQNRITFDAYQQNEYQRSWTNSSTVSHRLLQYVCEELKPYSQNEWQSMEHVQFKITQLVRPMLETIRNLFRNIILLKEMPSRPLIKLCPIVLSQPATICYKCSRIPKQFSDFWILPDNLHTFVNKCNDCHHSKRSHINVDCQLEYKLIQHESMKSSKTVKADVRRLRMAILEYSQFYGYVVASLKQNDPILSALNRIIAEEHRICSEKGPMCLNSTLHDKLVDLIEEYKEKQTIPRSAAVSVDLLSLYEQIKSISEIDEISEQIHAIKQTQKRYLTQHEKQVSRVLE